MTSEEFHTALHHELRQPIEPPHTTPVGHATVKVPARDRGHRAWWTYATINLAQHRIQIQVNLNLKRNDLSQADYTSSATWPSRIGADEWDVKCLLLVSKLAF